MEFKENVCIIKQEQMASDVYSIWIETKDIAREAKPGQFISVYSNDASRILPRPISICEIDGNKLRLVYRVVGKGTKEFSSYKAGGTLNVLGPLGNGYIPKEENKSAVLLGGGIGIPPMLELAKQLKCKKTIILGYRDELFLDNEFKSLGDVYIATEDGSEGTKGNVLDVLKKHKEITADVIYACGPKPMLRAVKDFAFDNGIEAYISLEERMACGIGACLACVCKTKETDHHSNVNNARICKDGPVFNAKEVEF